MPTKIQFRRDTATNWNTINPILSQGEMGMEIDSEPFKFKVGDGVKRWNLLPYEGSSLSKQIIDTALGDISQLKTDVSGQATLIGQLGTTVSGQTSTISSLQTTTSTNTSSISNLQSLTSTHTASISTMQTDLTAVQSSVNASPVSQCWVSPSGSDSNNGSISTPYKTIQKALTTLTSIINVLPGTYTEDLTIPSGYGLYGPIIAGSGTFESPKSEVHGTITIGSGVSRLRIKNMQLDGNSVGPAIIDNGSEGRHVLENCTVSHAASNGDLIRVTGGKNWWNIEGSTIEGQVNLVGTGTSATFNIMNSPGSFLTVVVVRSGYMFSAFNVNKLGPIFHYGGNVFCSYVGAWYPYNNNIITSTSINPADIVGVGYSSFTADTVNYGTIASTGATVLKNYNTESLYSDVCLSAVSTVATTLITTTTSTLIADTKKVERNISYNTTNGEVTFLKTGTYTVAVSLKVDCTEWNKKLELWFEKYNTTSAAWEAVADTGFVQLFQTDQENVPHYDFASYFVAGEKYRLRALSDTDTTMSVKTITLTNGVKMPAIRISIHG